jgi:hypothetical protein
VHSEQDAAVLFQASYEGSVSTDPEEPTAPTVAGLLGRVFGCDQFPGLTLVAGPDPVDGGV